MIAEGNLSQVRTTFDTNSHGKILSKRGESERGYEEHARGLRPHGKIEALSDDNARNYGYPISL